MSAMSLRELLADTRAPEIRVTGLCLDSRRVEPGDAFVALAGQQAHGLRYLDQALERGAAAVLWEPHPGVDEAALAASGCVALAVPRLGERLGELAARLYGDPSGALTVLGVTGTNGKSSSVHFLGQALDRLGEQAGTIGTLGWGPVERPQETTHTTPDAATLQRQLAELRDQGIRYVAMEVSSHALAQGRVDAIRFRGAIFTNLSRDHLDYHGDMEGYADAKGRLFAATGLEFAILNADDPVSERYGALLAPDVRRLDYGIEAGAVRAEDLKLGEASLAFRLVTPRGAGPVEARLLGRFNVYNLLAVAATLLTLGWELDAVREALARLEPVPGRMSCLGGGSRPLVVVDYAHTPDALAQALDAVRAHVRGRLFCVFGCGGERDRGKRAEMAAAAEARADRIIVTDDNPRGEDGDAIAADILAGFQERACVEVIRDRAQAIARALVEAGADDLVLIAGKGHEDYQEIAGERLPFDDRQTAARLLEACP